MRPLRLPREASQPFGAFKTMCHFAQPAVGVAFPVVLSLLRGARGRQRAPLRQKVGQAGQRFDGDPLHFVNGRPEVAFGTGVVEGGQHRLGAFRRRRRHVDRHDVLSRAIGEIDAQHFVEHFVLPEIDLSAANRQQQRSEDRTRPRVVLGQKCVDALTQVMVNVLGIGVACANRRLGKRSNLPETSFADGLGGAQPDPPRAAWSMSALTRRARTDSSSQGRIRGPRRGDRRRRGRRGRVMTAESLFFMTDPALAQERSS